jgi:ectoine hydroxylase-related dioxygenase (phytanoyl-CoA dioxygenase family)
MKGSGELTAEHTDYYYFKNNTDIFKNYTDNANKYAKNENCIVCNDDRDEDKTVICDLCDRNFHFDCLNPTLKELPSGEFHCFDCANAAFPYWTCWIAMGDVNLADGRLCLIPGTHKLNGYHNTKNELLPSEFTKAIENKAVWRAADLKAGDLILFNIKTVHAASKNLTHQYRVSCDTRVTTFTKQIRNLQHQHNTYNNDNCMNSTDNNGYHNSINVSKKRMGTMMNSTIDHKRLKMS